MSWNWRDGGGVDVTRPGSQLIILAPFSTKVEKRMTKVEKRMTKVEKRMAKVEKRMTIARSDGDNRYPEQGCHRDTEGRH